MKYTKIDLQEMYDQFLNATQPQVKVAGMEFAPSQVLKDSDPIAYKEGLYIWIDAEIKAGELSIDAWEYDVEL